MRAEAKTASEVRAVLQKVTEAYANRDLDGFLGCFAPDDDVVLYGTGADEKRVGLAQIRAQVERDWAQTESASISYDWTSISAAGSVAWAAADGAFVLGAEGQDIRLAARCTFVLEKREGRWLVVQAHFSTPAAGQEEGSSY
jgi:uncharacterized protein (TIGR02246 family)